MKEKKEYKTLLPTDLYKQIEEIYESFHDIQCEVSGIVTDNKVTNTAAHLEDVLQSTEEATHTILDAATEIQMLCESGKEHKDIQAGVTEQVTKIYEACNFQDVSGQRIKKVLKHMSLMEERLSVLAKAAKAYVNSDAPEEVKTDKSLLNGPQLIADAPSQEEIDKLFSSLK